MWKTTKHRGNIREEKRGDRKGRSLEKGYRLILFQSRKGSKENVKSIFHFSILPICPRSLTQITGNWMAGEKNITHVWT